MKKKQQPHRLKWFHLFLAGALALTVRAQVALGAATAPENDPPWLGEAFSADPEEMVRAAEGIPMEAGASILVLLDEHRLVYDEDGRSTRTRRMVYRTVAERARDDWQSISVLWEPWHQEPPQIRARSITREGIVHWLNPDTLSESEIGKRLNNVYSDLRVLQGPLPAMAPGTIVETETTIRDRIPYFDAGEAIRIAFGHTQPTLQTRLTVDAPSSLPLRYSGELLPDLKMERREAGGTVHLVFENGPLGALTGPPDLLPPETPRYPGVAISTGTSWKAVAARYADQVDEKIRGADSKLLLGEAPDPAKERESLVAGLVERLHERVRYTGVEFGEAALVPRTPEETLQRRYGDCKDKSALLVAMLRAAGQPAYLALLSASPSRDVDPELPGMGLFDHAIVYVPGTPPVWIDATDEFARIGTLPFASQGRLALIIDPKTDELVRTPEASPSENHIIETREFFLEDMGPARVVETNEFNGAIENTIRSRLAGGDIKEIRQSSGGYVREVYLSEKIPEVEFSDVHDFSHPFQLRLDVAEANRGYTDVADAIVAIDVADITSRLPYALLEDAETGEELQEGSIEPQPESVRTADWLLNAASVTEWRYRIHPPPGFRVQSLPDPEKSQFGPASFSREFKEEPDGSVTGILRFDMGSRRFSAAQGKELRDGVRALSREKLLVISYEHHGFALLEAGKTRDALLEFRAISAGDPKASVHHVRTAEALLRAGLGEASRDEARKATEMNPESALAWRTLGWILQHDLLGRRFRRGFDYDGALAAYRKAVELDSDDQQAIGDMAILLEHSARGVRYGTGARLEEAIASFQRLNEEWKSGDLADNIALDYLKLRKLKECMEFVDSLPATQGRLAIKLAATALGEGAAAAIREAGKEVSEEDISRTVLRNTAAQLIQLREYALASEMLSFAARGAQDAAQVLGQAGIFSRTKRFEDTPLPEDDPSSVLKRFVAFLFSPDHSREELRSLLTRTLFSRLDDPDEYRELERQTAIGRQALRNLDMPFSVAKDLVMSNLEISMEGDADTGFLVHATGGFSAMSVIVVWEDGGYRILDMPEDSIETGRFVLALAELKKLDRARRFLDWVRDATPLGGGEDPYSGEVFPRLWEKGSASNEDEVRVAAASLAAVNKRAPEALDVLRAAREKTADKARLTALNLALAKAYIAQEDYKKLLPIAEHLLKSAPKSETAFLWVVFSQMGLRRWRDAAGTIAARLDLLPEDPAAVRAAADLAAGQGRFEEAVGQFKRLTEMSHANANDWNNLAWTELFLDSLPEDALSNAQRAITMNRNPSSIELHTLGCVLAVSGKASEAHSVMLQAMDAGGLEEPDSAMWLLFGLIAEEYGEGGVAAAAYRRVKAEKNEPRDPTSSYKLAQRRLKLISGTSRGE